GLVHEVGDGFRVTLGQRLLHLRAAAKDRRGRQRRARVLLVRRAGGGERARQLAVDPRRTVLAENRLNRVSCCQEGDNRQQEEEDSESVFEAQGFGCPADIV